MDSKNVEYKDDIEKSVDPEHEEDVRESSSVAAFSVEELFGDIPVPPWREQITLRAVVVSALLGAFFSIITHRLNLTVGVIPSLNVSAGLLGFFFIKVWTTFLSKLGIWSKPFTRQENTVIQTCIVSCYGIAFSGGFGTYLLSLDRTSYDNIGSNYKGNRAQDVKTPSLGWIYAFVFTVSFLGVLVLVPLRKIMILKYKLTYPSGTATAVLINSFHTPQGAKIAKKQIKSLGKSFCFSFLWSFFKWFYSGLGDATCGFDSFPSLGLKAYANRFYFDFNLTYIGAGMICPHIVNVSVLIGAIASWGFMWPLINNREGDWYPANLPHKSSNFEGLYGYKVFVAIALILGDGLYNFVKIFIISTKSVNFSPIVLVAKTIIISMKSKYYNNETHRIIDAKNYNADNGSAFMSTEEKKRTPAFEGLMSIDEKKRTAAFLQDRIPVWVAASGYVALAAISIGVMPHIFPPLKWYYVFICYILAPVFAFCNAYGCGLTDWSLASTYGKLGLFVFAAWAGSQGGVVAGLGACGVMMSIVSTASDLMQDFKTGYLTRSSPRSMFASQLLGTLLGCIMAPITFWMFWKAFDIGNEDGQYKAPYAVIYRQMAIIGVEGFSALPTHCLQLCYGFFAFAIVVNAMRDIIPPRFSKYIPIPMAMAIPFYIGAYFTIDMFIGTIIVFVWQLMNREKSEIYVPAVASGLICGDGVWSVPSAILALARVNSPICMMFYPSKIAAAIQDNFP